MLSQLLSALSVARHAVALTLVASAAATTMVAGAVDQIGTQSQHETAPMTSTAPTPKPEPTAKSEVAGTVASKPEAPEASRKPATNEKSSKPEPKTNDIEALAKYCVAKYTAAKDDATLATVASEVCRRAIEASGLTSTEFWARFAPKAEPTKAPVKPSTDPASIEALAKYCITKYAAAQDSTTAATVASEVCRRAIEASGLTATEFWAKFGKPQAPKSEPKPTPTPTTTTTTTALSQLTRYCLTLHAALTTTSTHEQVERTTTVCNQAIAESKLTPTQFWTKFSVSN